MMKKLTVSLHRVLVLLVISFFSRVSLAQLPSGWLDGDIGSVSVAGSANYSGGTFTVNGGGTIGGTADGFHFAYQSLSGDGSIVARLVTLQGVTSPQAGVMIRETLNANATNAFVYYSTNYGHLQSRTTSGGGATIQNGSFTSSTPYWLKLIRSGNIFTGYISSDGIDWVQTGTSTITMATNVYIGLAVANNGSSTVETATFDSASVSSTTAPAPAITSVSATTGTIGGSVTLTGTNFGSTQGTSEVLLNGSPVTINSWSSTSITITIPSGATSGLLVVSIAPNMNDSNAIYFTVTNQPLPSGWLDQDIGVVSPAGSATYSNGIFTVNGSGSIGSTADGLHFAYQSMSGDGFIVARLVSLQGSAPQAGVMIRESMNANATDVFVYYTTNNGHLLSRTTTGGSTTSQNGSFTSSTPYWLKVVRSGNTFTGYISTNGFDWVQTGTSSIAMASNVYVGLAAANSGYSTLATASFDNVSVSSAGAPGPEITGISATTGSIGGQVTITGSGFGATQGGSEVLLNGGAVTIDSWSATSITITIPSGATSGPLLVVLAPNMDDSNAICFTVTSQPLPSGWLDQDIGIVSVTGSAGYSGGTFTVTGGGTIGGTADGLHFVYLPLNGDGSIVARVVSLQGASSPQAGIMIRETLNSGATSAFVYYTTNYGRLLTRATSGGSTAGQTGTFTSATPYWLQLVRSGNTFTGYISSNGFDWIQTGTSTISMATNIYIGLGVANNSSSTAAVATFDNVSVSSTTSPAPVITAISATTGSVGSQITVTGNNFGVVQGGSVISLHGTALTTSYWSNTSIIFTVPTGATSGPLLVTIAPIMNESNAIYFTVTSQPLPTGWFDQDIGTVTATGSAGYSNGTFTVNGSGTIGGTADSLHFVYQSMSGDGSIVARVVSRQSYAALVIRQTLFANSIEAHVAWSPNTVALSYRLTTGGSPSSQWTGYSAATPYWLKLARSGNTFTGYISQDGVEWTQVGTESVTMTSNVFIGLAEAGSGSSITSTFDSVSINTAAMPAPAITSISATSASVGDQVELTGANFGATQNQSIVTINGTQAQIDYWTDTSIVFTVPAGATSGRVFVMEAPSMNASNPAYLTITPYPLPSPWLDADVGSPGAAGSATYSAGTFTISGAGSFTGTGDSMHFMYQSLTGDGSISARVTNRQGTVALMMRENLLTAPIEAYALWFPNSAELVYRTTSGGATSYQYVGYSVTTPYWLRLIRTGNTFTAYVSQDGVSWTLAGTETMTMAQTVDVGIVVAGGSSLTTSTFDNVLVTEGTTPYVSSVNPLVAGVGNAVTITGSNFGTAQGSSTVSFNNAVASSVSSWSNSQIVATVPSSVPSGQGPVTVTVNSIVSNGNVMFTAVNPVLTGIDPPNAAPGATVTIIGTGLQLSGQQTTVSFNGVSAQIQKVFNDSVVVWVPPSATNGPVTVSVGSFTSNGLPFNVEGNPTVTGISPSSGVLQGWPIIISGSGFGAVQSTSTLTFNNSSPATIISWGDTSISAIVPSDAETGPVTVSVGGLSATGGSFNVQQQTQVTDSFGNQSTYVEQMVGETWRVIQSTGSGCSSCTQRGNIQSQYDANGNLTSQTDELGHTTTYTYDSNNNVLSVTKQLDANTPVTTSYTYNSFGEVLTMTDPLGNVTTNVYDAKGNLTSVTSPAPNANTPASVTQFGYNSLGELTSITDPLSHSTTLTYTTAGLIASITDAQNNTTSYQYDVRGNRTAVIDPINGSAHPTTFAYDVMNHLTGITYPDGSSVSFGYDTRGRRTSVTDQNNKTTTYVYDDADRLTSVTDPAQNATQYNYDTENNLLSITDANGHVTSFSYDAFGRVTQTAFPSSLAESYAYDAVGNLTSKTDRNGHTIQYVYDALNRLTQKSYPDSTTANYVYDLVGKIRQVTDPTGVYGFAYDNMGRLIGTSTSYSFLAGTYSNTYTYDAASNRTSLTAPDGSITTYGYDTLNRLNGLANSWAGTFGFGYDALSRRTSLTRPNGVNTSYSYDSVSHLLSVLHQTGGTTIDGASYTYDSAGNRTSKANYLTGTTENYGYDPLYQLTQVTQGGSTTESYSYDPVGNRLSSLGVPLYQYNSSNELTSSSAGNYTYDNDGNTLTDAQGRSFTWDFESRLMQIVVPGTNGGTTTFTYDPFGRRIRKSGPLGVTNYLYDQQNLVSEVDSSGTVIARYTQGKDIDRPLAQLRSGTTSYYQQDGLGSVTSLSNSASGTSQTYTYGTYGNTTASTGTLTNPFQYTGRELDSETGIYYYRARYFDPSEGRFLNQDPIRFGGGANFYAYTRNNPVVRKDPFGYYSGSGVVGSIYLGPDGVWQNDDPPLPSDLPAGCSPEQWAQSPNACAGPQGADDPDPYTRPPDPNKCAKADQPQDEPQDQAPQIPPTPSISEPNDNCRNALIVTGIGAVTTVGYGVAIYYTAGEATPALEGLDDLLELSDYAHGMGSGLVGPLGVFAVGVSNLGSCF